MACEIGVINLIPDNETEAQKYKVTHPNLHMQGVTKGGFNPGLYITRWCRALEFILLPTRWGIIPEEKQAVRVEESKDLTSEHFQKWK